MTLNTATRKVRAFNGALAVLHTVMHYMLETLGVHLIVEKG